MLLSILEAVFVLLLVATAEHALNHGYEVVEGDTPKYLSCTGEDGWTKAAVIAAVVGLVNYFAPRSGAWYITVLCYLAILAVIVFIVATWWRDGSERREMIPFLLLLIPVSLTFMATVAAVKETAFIGVGRFWISVWNTVNPLLILAAYGVILITFFQRRFTETENGAYRVAAILLAVLIAIWMVSALISGISWKSLETLNARSADQEVVANETQEVAVISDDYRYRHDLVLIDNEGLSGDALAEAKLNDFDFGPSPVFEILLEKVDRGELSLSDVTNRSEEEALKLVTANEVFIKFLEDLKDPAVLAACTAWYDVNMHTNLLGDFFVNVKGQEEAWMRAINGAAAVWDQNPEAFQRAYENFTKALWRANSITVDYMKSGLEDQMYMYGLTVGELPTVIVMETAQESGTVLTVTNVVKGKTVSFSYRVTCDFQPLNVAGKMEVTPKRNPNAPSKPTPPAPSKPTPPAPSTPTETTSGGSVGTISGGSVGTISGGSVVNNNGGYSGGYRGSSSSGSHGGGGGGSSTNVKDPTKGTAVGNNDTPSPGPSTNNGVGAQNSSADLPTNSVTMTETEYKEASAELKDVSENQRVGGDSNTPSYTPPPATISGGSVPSSSGETKTEESNKIHVDSNADTGTGYGGIDKPTPVTEPVHVVVNETTNSAGNVVSETIDTVSNDPVGVEWGGPPD